MPFSSKFFFAVMQVALKTDLRCRFGANCSFFPCRILFGGKSVTKRTIFRKMLFFCFLFLPIPKKKIYLR